MTKSFVIAVFLTLVLGELPAQKLTSYFDYKVFQVPGEGLLLETYFDTKGASVEYVAISDSMHQANIELKIIVSKSSGGIKDFRKESIKSPISHIKERPDFINIQQFLLSKGSYTLEIELLDVNSKNLAPVLFTREVNLELNSDRVGFSDVQLLAGFRPADKGSMTAKAGVDMLPYMSNVYGTEFNELFFYVELYSMEKELKMDDAFLLTYFLEDADYEKIIASTEVKKRVKASSVHSELGLLDISKVPTGRYNLRLEARNRDLELLASKELSIYRENKNLYVDKTEDEINLTFVGSVDSKDSLLQYMYSLRPIASEQERAVIDNLSKSYTLYQCKSFFYTFWTERNAFDPSSAWNAYNSNVSLVEDAYGTSNRAGYETDMGRIYLRYGEPNSIVNEANDTEAYPYQIWHYYKAGKFTDRRFVFYDPELLNREYTLLHSDVPGEIRNPRWNIIINSRNNAIWNTEQNRAGGNGSQRLQERYDSPH
jgi:GWxTD domain-containing protein